MRLALSGLSVLLLAGAAPSAEPVRFDRDIRPLLAHACLTCHGPGKQRGALRLDRSELATKPNKNSDLAAIVPGNATASEVVRRLTSHDAAEVMPPPESKARLTKAEIDLVKRWIDEGAVYEPLWSFSALVAPPVPNVPNVPISSNPVDAFLEVELAKRGQTPNAEADRPTLIRRVSFALTGLPPTLKEVDAFLADKRPGAYERMVDRYLASPRHGEEMARHWLDLVRYADTHGLHLDNERGVWPYRDWVVKAFNDNKRFDAFTVEQLAGDLLPRPTKDQLVATGFNRCNVSTGEGGSIVDEWHYRNAVDRAAAAAETFLGLTAGCAQCHDHKFDPISQKEFYSLYAFYLSAAGSPLDGNALLHDPSVKLATPEQERKLTEWDRRLAAVNGAITTATNRYADPALAAAVAGTTAALDANDPAVSFVAWVKAKGGETKPPEPIAAIFKALGANGKPNANQTRQLREHYLRNVCQLTDAVLDPLMKSRDTLTADRQKFDATIPASLIFRDAPSVRTAYVMARGQYDKPGEKVEPGTLAALPPMRATGRATRLDLAKWVVEKDNPLPARVYVNRLWQQLFGTGLVKTANDFGTQGERPSHPELLDWLAAEFRDGGWDVRAKVRLIVTSKAFRRSSKASSGQIASDPENRFLARGPRFRLDAEQVRDNALAVSGLLDLTLGGKGVKPYQPDNIWEPVAYTDSNTRFYKRDSGTALYRRTLYTFFKRTAPPPYMANFDAPNREQPCGRRDRSNTPLQALQLLNDPQHVEAARVFAERIVSEGGPTDAERLTFAFKTVLSRPPIADELAVLTDELAKHKARYAKSPADAKKLLAVGEAKPKEGLDPAAVAAYALVAGTILNLDETLTRN